MSKTKTVILKPIEPKQEGFVIDDELYFECAKRVGAKTEFRTPPQIYFNKETIAHIIAAFLERYEQKQIEN